jgi:hypothetical protein
MKTSTIHSYSILKVDNTIASLKFLLLWNTKVASLLSKCTTTRSMLRQYNPIRLIKSYFHYQDILNHISTTEPF